MSRAPQGLAVRAGAVERQDDGVSALLRHVRDLAARISILRLARQALFLAAFVTAWITLKPFSSLSGAENGDLVTGQDGITYVLFGLLSLFGVVLAFGEHRRALVSLLTPLTVALVAWLPINGMIGQDPATSIKRFALTAAVLLLTACLPLLPRSRQELRNLLAAAALMVLAVCYLGVLLVPELAIHQPTDFLEPALAGDWRGSFGHKNAAAAVMAMLVFVGIAVFQAGLRAPGIAVTTLSAIFLIGCEGKSAGALTIVVLAITACFGFVRSLAGRALLTLGPVLLVNVVSVGSVLNDGLASLVAALPIDATFTNRTDVWKFALDAIAARPITGYGYAAFWATESVRDNAQHEASWAGIAAHSHNSYVETLVTLGAIGLALTLIVLVVAPLVDFHRARSEGTPEAPFAMLFLRIWLFGVLLSSMESFFYDRADSIWFTFIFAVFGLRYLARFGTR